MKDTNHIIAAFILLGALSCARMEETGLEQVTFQAIHGDVLPSKTVLQSDGSVFWSPGDEINMFYKSTWGKFTSNSTEPEATTSFSGSIEVYVPNGEDEFWAVYPYNAQHYFDHSQQAANVYLPDTQGGVAGTFNKGYFISMAKSKDYSLSFYNLCGGIKFCVSEPDIEYVTFQGKNNEVLAGQVKATFDENGKPVVKEVVNGQTKVRLNAPEGGFVVGEWYYIVTLPVTLSAGYTMTFFKDASGTVAAERAVETSVIIKRSTWGRLTDADDVTTPINPNKYLTFTSEGTTKISLTNNAGNAPVFYYSTDAVNWSLWDYSELTFTANEPLYICGNNPEGVSQLVYGGSDTDQPYSTFSTSGDAFSVSGDIMSLIDNQNDVSTIPSDGCFQRLFYKCSGLISAPSLPATALTVNSYYRMFGASGLTTAPELPATVLAEGCYTSMFSECYDLIAAPKLPATQLESRCYSGMFANCRSLTSAPELPVTDLAEACYASMFSNCPSLTDAPKLPATVLANSCYNQMFRRCTNLRSAPELPASVLSEKCYYQMFQSCTNLQYVSCLATDISATSCIEEWLSGVASTGTFVKSPDNHSWAQGASGIPEGWTVENSDGSAVISPNKYLTFTSEGTTTVSLTNNGGNAPVLYYSNNTQTWFQWDYSELTFTANEPLYICGDNPQGLSHKEDGVEDASYSQFVSSGDSFSVSGDIMSLLNKDTDLLAIPSSWCFLELFRGCANITAAPSLPATELAPYCYYNMFMGCSSLTAAPELPATTMTAGCYSQMFRECSSLSAVPQLPATVLARSCYSFMFSDCAGITSVPEDYLPVTQLEDLCYGGLFQNCKNLTNAPSLPSTTLARQCYFAMFNGCSLLQTAPELPATTLAERCYRYMFSGCSSLSVAPALPAETLEAECYYGMFQACSGLTSAPVLPASVLAEKCYYQMFQSCTNLQYVSCLATDISASDCLERWLAGVAATGTFVKSPDNHSWTLGADGIPEGWTVENSDGSEVFTASNYLTFTSTGNSTLTIGNTGGNAPVLYYSYDKLNWDQWDYGQLDFTTLYLCGDNPNGFSFSASQASTLVVGGDDCHIYGSVMSLLNKDEALLTIPSDYCFYALFFTSSNILTPPSLPATELTDYCYGRMFESCRELTSAPELPAPTLKTKCYTRMFANCEALATAPVLPATTVAPNCYEEMFYYCTSMTTVPTRLPATVLAKNCYDHMFLDCWSITDTPLLPATTLAEECYLGMFASCRKLTVAYELPAEVMVQGCYKSMFFQCPALTNVPELPATTLAESCYEQMFYACTALTAAPVLPASVLQSNCYSYMFNQCSSLNYVKCLATDMSATGCISYWLGSTAEAGTFVQAANVQWPSGVSGIPEGWTIEYE